MNLKTRQYGPFRGMMSSIDRDVVPLDRITGDSRNVVMDPLTGAVLKRLGNAAIAPTTGLLESKWGSVGRQLFEVNSVSPSDGLPIISALFTNETTNEGQIVFKDTGGVNQWDTLGKDYGSAHYPYDAGSVTAEFIMQPLKSRHSPTTATQRRDYSRCIDAIQRKTLASGARNLIQMNDEVFCPSYSATPFRWNKRFNVSAAAGDEINRIRPWYNQPPAYMPVLTAHNGTAGFLNGKWFYFSIMYLMDDGSYTMPVVPREPNGTLTAGYGLFKLSADADYITWADLADGPNGTRKKILLRSIQGTSAAPPPAGDLRICGVVGAEVTSFIDTNATDNDVALISDPVKVRFDHVAPWRARYVFTSNERVWLCNRRPNPGAFFCCFCRSASTLNQPDTYGNATKYSVAVREDQTGVSSKRYFVTKTPADVAQPGGAAGEVTYDLSVATNSSLQGLLDSINVTAYVPATTDAWRAQGVPGADLSASTANLNLTQLVIPCDTNSTKTLTLGAGKSSANVCIGMRVYGNADIPAGAYVKSVTASTVVMGDASGADLAATGTHAAQNIYFGWETGDTNPGEMNTYSSAYPCTLYWSEAYLDSVTDAADKRRVMFTSAEPGWAKNTPQSFFTGNRLVLPDSAGVAMGGAELLNGPILGVVCGSSGIYIIHNPRGGNTGLDADMNLRPLNANRGCISPYSIVRGDNWVGYLTIDGFVVTDGVTENVISRDVWNVSTQTGEWAYEIGQCVNGAATDTDTCRFFAFVSGGRLYVSYRSASNAENWPDRMMVYDFSPGIVASGLQEVVLATGEAYGWSSPLVGVGSTWFRPGPMGVVRAADGIHKYFVVSINDGTSDGMIEEFEKANYSDDGTAFTSTIYTKTDRFDSLRKKTIHAVRALYLKGAGTARTRASIELARTTLTTVLEYPTAAYTAAPARLRQDVPLGLKPPIDLCELKTEWYDASNSNVFRVNLIEVDYEELNSYQ